MKDIRCPKCGANSFTKKGLNFVCDYCGGIFVAEDDEKISVVSNAPAAGHGISLNNDVEVLLEKCRKEPWNARRYANLVLDIDPLNEEALKLLQGGN